MEDDLKTLEVQYLSNHWLDHTQIYNLVFGDQTKLNKCFKKTTKKNSKYIKNLSNHWLDCTFY